MTVVRGTVASDPKRVVIDQHGHYWRDYAEAGFISMPPVSDENVETDIVTVYVPIDTVALFRKRDMPDGTPCWCANSIDMPHEGWIHGLACSDLRLAAARQSKIVPAEADLA